FGISLARLAALRRRSRRWIRESVPFDAAGARPHRGAVPETRVSAEVSVPCAIGGRRPVVLLPAGLADAISGPELEAVICHEREHLLRRDPARTAFESYVTAFWWFHPAVRVLVARRSAIREERCDDAVVRRFPGAVYGRALVAAARFAGPMRRSAIVAATGPARDLGRRLRRISDPRQTPPRRIAAALAVAAAAALLVPGVRPAVGPALPVERASR
ncbi:MAG TPA: M56 family metallopeptidase, partial [Thermoanaerobaculia bacterium]|nr:M56 family metallopeptidase [Thermoanaerobaculia bacterium]